MALDAGTLAELARLGLGENLTGQSAQQLEDALYGRSEADINRRSGLDTQAALENTFGRGVGQLMGPGGQQMPSSISATAIDPILRARSDALTKARMDAFTASQAARLAALGQAAAVSQNAITSGASAGAQQQALNLQKRGQDITKSAGEQQMIGQGVGGLGGAALTTAGLAFGPEIKKNLRGLLGLGGETPLNRLAGNANLGPGDTLGPPSPTAGKAGMEGFGGGGTGPSAAAPSFDAPSFNPVSFEMPSSYGFGDTGGLGNLATWNAPDIGWEDWLNNTQTPDYSTWGSYL